MRRLLSFMVCVVFGLLPVVQCHWMQTPRTNASNLCSRSHSQTCSHMLTSSSAIVESQQPEVCIIQVANSTHPSLCDSQMWSYEDVCPGSCGIHLEAYRHTLPSLPLYRTALNLSLGDMPHETVRIRYTDYSASNRFSFCLNVSLSTDILPLQSNIWYDCVFHSRSSEGKQFLVEFLSGGQYGVYLFDLPTERQLEEGRGLVYIHLHRQPERVVVTYQTSDGDCQLYYITVCSWNGAECIAQPRAVVVDLNDETTYIEKWKNSVTVSVDSYLPAGNYSVRVHSWDNCSYGYQAMSSAFIVADRSSGFYLIAVIVAIVVFVCSVSACTKKMFSIAMKNEARAEMERWTVLLLHDPSASDRYLLDALRIYLKEHDLDVRVDFVDIPNSGHKDPLVWYSEAVEKADAVAVLAPTPTTYQLSQQVSSIYPHIFDLALALLAARIARLLKEGRANLLGRFVVLETVGSLVPDACSFSSFQRFRIPGQLPLLMRHWTRNGHLPSLLFRRTPPISFQKIYDQVCQHSPVAAEAGSVAERSSLTVEESDVEANRECRLRQHLDNDFGHRLLSVASLPPVNGDIRV